MVDKADRERLEIKKIIEEMENSYEERLTMTAQREHWQRHAYIQYGMLAATVLVAAGTLVSVVYKIL